MFTAVPEDFFVCVLVGRFTSRRAHAFSISENSEMQPDEAALRKVINTHEECCDTGQLIDKRDLVVSFQ